MKITLDRKQTIYFTSDTHYSHKNICSATTEWSVEKKVRKFKSLDHMNTTLVDNINATVGEDDVLIHMGDWSFGGEEKVLEFRRRVHCKNIHLLEGNHDYDVTNLAFDKQHRIFETVKNYQFLSLKVPNEAIDGRQSKASQYRFVLCHYPFASWNGMAKRVMHLHGHIHTPTSDRVGPGRMLDVGVDGHPEFRPYSLKEVLKLIEGREVKGLLQHTHDHHS